MSERDQTSGWHTPKSEWHAPEKTDAPRGWRKPTLPSNMPNEPQQAGDWHLPAPEDTVLETDDAPAQSTPSTPTATGAIDPNASPEDLSLYLTAEKASSGLPTLDDDDDMMSMSELVALASLADQSPAPNATPVASSPIVLPSAPTPSQTSAASVDPAVLSPAERAAMGLTGGGLSAEEYARQQLAALDAEESGTVQLSGTGATPPISSTTPTGALSPEEYARQQLAMLGEDSFTQPAQATGGTAPISSGFTPAPAAPAYTGASVPASGGLSLTPEQQALAQQYHNTEAQVRTLRAQWQRGEITREQLEEQMRALMVRDETNTYWMMGVDSDIWYKFENNEWVISTPPVLELEARASDQVSGIRPMTEASLPYITESPQPAQYQPTGYGNEEGLRVDENFMPLPRVVPRVDPEATMPATGGVYLADRQPGATIPSAGTPYSAPTIPSASVNYGGEPYTEAPNAGTFIASPIDQGEEDAIEDAESEIEKAQKRRQRTTQEWILIGAAAFFGIIFIGGILVSAALIISYNSIASEWRDEVEALANYEPQFQTARIYAADGSLLAELSGENAGLRTPVSLDEISPYMIHAVVSTENERYFTDAGYDLVAIGRAFLQNWIGGDVQSGASTITMQIARNLILQDSSVTAERKLAEMIVAAEIAQRYSKEFILELYMNEFNFGNQSFGVEEASQFYFDIPASDLNYAQSALLAGLIAAPATYDPVTVRDTAFQRMRVVLDRMDTVQCLPITVAAWSAETPQPPAGEPFCIPDALLRRDDNGDPVGEASVEIARVEARPYTPRENNREYPHFLQFVQAQLEQNFGPQEIYRRGFTIRTTLVPSLQDEAQDALVTTLAQRSSTGLNTGAVMVVDPGSGAILAMVGSPDFNNPDIAGQVNGALTWQQPGSSIKPITYLAAMEGVGDRNANGLIDPTEYLTPASILWDVPTIYPQYGNYQPTNFDNRFRGPVPVRAALAQSLNVPAVKVFEFIGVDTFTNMAARLGLNFLPETQFTLATGVGATDVRLYDMMRAYATIANGGVNTPLFAIESITDASGQDIPFERPQPQRVVAPNLSYLVQNILSDDSARAPQFGANSALTIQGWPTQNAVAVKTGTSDQNRDLWTMGFTTNRVVGVWLGRHDNQPTQGDSLSTAAVVWNRVMTEALNEAGGGPRQFSDPGGGSVVPARICADTGALEGATCTSPRNELFAQDRPPPAADTALVATVNIDTWTGLRANQFCPDNVVALTVASIPDQAAISWINSTAQGQQWAQRVGLALPLQTAPLPSAQCDMSMSIPVVRMTQPVDEQTVVGTLQITGVVSAPDFRSYQIELAAAANPTAFQIIIQPTTTPQPNQNSILGTWDSTTVPNGQYILRLAVFANNANNGYVYRTARITVNNPTPTATPTVPAIPTTSPFATAIPFDPLGTPFSAQGAPTPTATINPGG